MPAPDNFNYDDVKKVTADLGKDIFVRAANMLANFPAQQPTSPTVMVFEMVFRLAASALESSRKNRASASPFAFFKSVSPQAKNTQPAAPAPTQELKA